jgi:hypothetical protein
MPGSLVASVCLLCTYWSHKVDQLRIAVVSCQLPTASFGAANPSDHAVQPRGAFGLVSPQAAKAHAGASPPPT